jgi:hypothetical protein
VTDNAVTDDAVSGDAATGPSGAEGPDRVESDHVEVGRHMLEALVCPQTRAVLRWDPARSELISRAANLAYPVRGGIPIMLIDEARSLD